MAHEKSHVKTIWIVFFILLGITAIEVIFGIIKPHWMVNAKFIALSILNWTFIVLTLIKAYYIVWYFMHVKYETKLLRRTLTIPLYILIPYLTFIVLMEGNYIYDIFN